MKHGRWIIGYGAVWEIIRFSALLVVMMPFLSGNITGFYIGVWFGAAQLSLSLCFILVAVHPEKYGSMIRLLILSKILPVVPAVAFILRNTARFGVAAPAEWHEFASVVLPLGVIFVDAVVCVVLVGFARSMPTPEIPDSDAAGKDDPTVLRELPITQLEDE